MALETTPPMDGNAHVTWIDLVGYQYEIIHTAALEALLKGPKGLRAAQLLTGNREIAEVGRPRREGHALGAARTRADLTASLRMKDGSDRVLAVEVKVDSQATREQMERTGGSTALVVLLAVGRTSLQLSDLRTDALPDAKGKWSVVDLGAWVALWRDVGATTPELEAYVEAIAREHAEHQAAKAAAAGAGGLPGRAARLPDLSEWAWMSSVGEALREPFWCQAVISGPVMYWHDSARPMVGDLEAVLYLDLMIVHGRRRVVFKARGAGLGAETRVFERVVRALEDAVDGFAVARPPRRASRSFKLGHVELDHLPLEDALQVARAAKRELARIAECGGALDRHRGCEHE